MILSARAFLCLLGRSFLPASPSWLRLDHGGSGTDPASCAFSLQPVPPMFVPEAFLERSPQLGPDPLSLQSCQAAAGASVAPGQPRPHHCSPDCSPCHSEGPPTPSSRPLLPSPCVESPLISIHTNAIPFPNRSPMLPLQAPSPHSLLSSCDSHTLLSFWVLRILKF